MFAFALSVKGSLAAGMGPKPGSEKPNAFFHTACSRQAAAPPATVTSCLRFGNTLARALAACCAVSPSESRRIIVFLSVICAARCAFISVLNSLELDHEHAGNRKYADLNGAAIVPAARACDRA